MSNENSSRIYLKVGEIEISIEGSPDYVQAQYQQMAKDLNLQQKLQGKPEEKEKPKTKKSPQPAKTPKKPPKQETKETTNKKEFSAWLSKPPKSSKNNDKILVAGYINQLNSEENTFTIKNINNTLKENGINIKNPSSLINYMIKRKNVIKQVKKEGRQSYYQITKQGEKYLKNLLETKEK
jgi:predicted transcriptional regulator